jgi:hypothetical protein
MSINISTDITLDEVIPIIDRLSDIEREELRQILESKPKIDWQSEWEKVTTYFHSIFLKFPKQEVEADLEKALSEVRSGKTD